MKRNGITGMVCMAGAAFLCVCGWVLAAKSAGAGPGDVWAVEAEETAGAEGAFTMVKGAAVRLNEETGLRFQARMTDEYKEKTEASGGEFGFVIAPARYFEEAEARSEGDCDYIRALKELEGVGTHPALHLNSEPIRDGDGWMIQASIVGILYENLNLEFCAVAYAATGTGDTIVYEYAASEGSITENARAVSYVATAALNDEEGGYTEEEREILRDFVYRGVDEAVGLDKAASDAVTGREISIEIRETKPVALGEKAQFTAYVLADYTGIEEASRREASDMPVVWKSLNPEIAEVDMDGNVTAKAEGRAQIVAMVGEESVEAEVKCGRETFACTLREEGGRGLLNIEPAAAKVREGEAFTSTITVADEAYGELSFWINGEYYFTEEGECEFSVDDVSDDMEMTITDISSLLEYFEIKKGVIETPISKTDLPVKMILPVYSKEGELATTIDSAFFYAGTSRANRYENLQELWIPGNYEKIEGENGFRGCLSLAIIHLEGDALAETAATAEIDKNGWDECEALTEISIPDGSREKFETNEFWAEKSDVIEEREPESGAVSPVLSTLLPQTAVRREEGAGI